MGGPEREAALPDPMTIEEILTQLRVGPRTIAELTGGVPEDVLTASPEPHAWSVNDLLAHLRACGDVLGGAMLRILAEERPRYRRMSPRTYLRKTDYPTWRFEPAFEAFSQQRAELLAVLDRTSRPAWSRFAVVTEANGVRERDVRFYGRWLAGHERGHLEQIRRTVEAIRSRA